MYTNDFYRTQFSSNLDVLKKMVHDVDHKLLNTVPAPGKWCIGEVIDHLLIIGGRYLEVLEAKLNDRPESLRKGSGPYSHSFLIRLFIKVVSPEYKRKTPTIAPFKPHDHKNFDKNTLLSDFESLNKRFLALIDIADEYELDLGKIKVGNPIYPIWKMSISGCLAINEAHQRRHFGQIERVLEANQE
tara:strand:+ start:27031 stop:27591 length:561 start_codon:yes stop_codon:yes gene_type:complete